MWESRHLRPVLLRSLSDGKLAEDCFVSWKNGQGDRLRSDTQSLLEIIVSTGLMMQVSVLLVQLVPPYAKACSPFVNLRTSVRVKKLISTPFWLSESKRRTVLSCFGLHCQLQACLALKNILVQRLRMKTARDNRRDNPRDDALYRHTCCRLSRGMLLPVT